MSAPNQELSKLFQQVDAKKSGRRLLSHANTAKLVDSSQASVRRWSLNPETKFPEPVNVHNKLFWFADEVEAWIEARPRVSKKPSIMQGGAKRVAIEA